MATYNSVSMSETEQRVRSFLRETIQNDEKLLNYAVAVVLVCNATYSEHKPMASLPRMGVKYDKSQKGECTLRFKFRGTCGTVPLSIIANVDALEAVKSSVLDVEHSKRLLVHISLHEDKQKDQVIGNDIKVRQCPQMDEWAKDEDRETVVNILQITYNIRPMMPVLKAHVIPPENDSTSYALVIKGIPNITPYYVNTVIDRYRTVIEECTVDIYSRSLTFNLRCRGAPVKCMYMTTPSGKNHHSTNRMNLRKRRSLSSTLYRPPTKRQSLYE